MTYFFPLPITPFVICILYSLRVQVLHTTLRGVPPSALDEDVLERSVFLLTIPYTFYSILCTKQYTHGHIKWIQAMSNLVNDAIL